MPYGANIDIRDTVNYKNVMEQYNLGPNGGILTSLNLFATRFDQVMALCEKQRDPSPKFIVVDTPGQIEIFTWSASGNIIAEAFAASFPTVCSLLPCLSPELSFLRPLSRFPCSPPPSCLVSPFLRSTTRQGRQLPSLFPPLLHWRLSSPSFLLTSRYSRFHMPPSSP